MARPMSPTPVKLTHADYLQFPDDGRRHELLDGEHFVTASPRVRHQRVSRTLGRLLDAFVSEYRLGEIFTAPLDVILSDHDVVQPDLLFVSNERRAITQDWIRGAPDLVVEILSPSTRDRDEGLKRRVYRARGVREYWLVDPETETVQVHTFDPPAPSATTYDRSSILGSTVLAGFQIPVDDIFA